MGTCGLEVGEELDEGLGAGHIRGENGVHRPTLAPQRRIGRLHRTQKIVLKNVSSER